MLFLRLLADISTLHDDSANTSPKPSSQDFQPAALTDLFFALQLTSLGGFLIILLTVLLSDRVTKRHPIWVNFILSWIISCISYSFMVGHSIDWEPPRELCLTQAILVYTVPSLTAGATFALLVHVLIFFRVTFTFPEATRPRAIWYILLIFVPYVPALGMLFLSLGIGISDPGTVKILENGMYCNMRNEFPGKLSAIIVTVWMIACVILEVLIFKDLRRNWQAVRDEVFAHMKGTTIRIFVFSVSTIIAACLGVIFFFEDNHGPALNIIIALIPLNAMLVFGSQGDIIRSWISAFRRIGRLFCRRNSDDLSSSSGEGIIGMTSWSSQNNSTGSNLNTPHTAYPPSFYNAM
ncbi:hypothetical protein E1B28_002778 [Marasmius oreades]|uniref:Uncharacterized protein n=1 Tax=Marasmius oreades TaxID=181124 RepID=A0A9P7RP29_9AGAR|nr:uncharacterized protein E1B28_002778 [Marasmius oreades]KAG7086857.1 hypothetical protein E1B28_002778 [Marasmius oreades]